MRFRISDGSRPSCVVLRCLLLTLFVVGCGGDPAPPNVGFETDSSEPQPADVSTPEPDASSGGEQDAAPATPSACGKTESCDFSLTGHLIGGGYVISQDNAHALEQQLAAPNIVGATSDGAYTITPGLPGREAP